MRKPYFCAVIGKGFGDEGKGMAVDFLSSRHEKSLVIRHNGGAQSGHTVEYPGKRFVFHELSSGSFRNADTFWADTYFPDLYKLGEEVSAFCAVSGFIPATYGDAGTMVTLIDDVLINMAAEEARGDMRHGSCGMGIYEAQLRSEAGHGITLGELSELSEEALVQKLRGIRKEYLPLRLKELGLDEESLGEYGELLRSDIVLENTAAEMLKNMKYVKVITELPVFINRYDCVIFENGQGLLLDAEKEAYAPHVTASRTGLTNPCCFLYGLGASLDEVVYVTRSYVTRHGAGPLPGECKSTDLGLLKEDRTNVENPWQGRLRYARHGALPDFTVDIEQDLEQLKKCNMPEPICSLMITHLNETNYCMLCEEGEYDIGNFIKERSIQEIFQYFYLSDSVFGGDIKHIRSM